jgi:hypothetical protein
MSRRMEYTVAFDAPPEKILQGIKHLFGAEEAFNADWISKHL